VPQIPVKATSIWTSPGAGGRCVLSTTLMVLLPM
jgi:hypothetical protein